MASSLLLAATAICIANALPHGWETCPKRNNEECLTRAVGKAVQSLSKGDKGLGVPPVDPLGITRLEMRQGSSSPVSLDITFTDLTLDSQGTLSIQKARADWEKNELYVRLRMEKPMIFSGGYKMGGKILLLPIEGTGHCNLTYENFATDLKFRLATVVKGGKEYFEVKKCDVEIFTSRLHLDFQGLFGGDKALGDNMNLFMNDNWEEILKELRPSISQAFGEVFTQIANRVFSKIPKEELYTT